MIRLVHVLTASLPVPLLACYGGERATTGQCPAGEDCSEQTVEGLSFIGNSLVGDILWSGPRATAIGGTQVIALEHRRSGLPDTPLALPFTADDDGGLGVRVEATSGPLVTVRGTGSRSNYLRILDRDGLLMDRKELTGAAVERIELVPADWETLPEEAALAFAPGTRDIGIALYGEVQHASGPVLERIVDSSMQIDLAGAQRLAWDTVRIDVTLGTHPLAVTAGDQPAATLDLVVDATADSVTILGTPPSTITPNSSRRLCFQARSAGRVIVGLTWTFTVDGATRVQGPDDLDRNCISVSTTKTSGTVSIEASAGGQSTAMALTIGAAREERDLGSARIVPRAISVDGDRAAM